jgi:cytochrome c oxidase assembly protein subunit 15
MVEWRPLMGWIPPLTAAEWERVFALYRETPQYRQLGAGMDLAAFKEIFFWEWLHRLWGRLIGLVYALPLAFFWWRGMIPPERRGALIAILALGGAQGMLGWYMVMSGLVDRPSVSHFRLAAHLALATLIYAAIAWHAAAVLGVSRARAPALAPHAWATIIAVALTMTWGAFVAGLDAGFAYNTWPLMEGRILPPEAFTLEPPWRNALDNTALVQFIHRWLAIATAAIALALAWRMGREEALRGHAWWLAAAALGQVALGIATLLAAVPVALGAAHQAGALILLTLALLAAFRCRRAPAAGG